MKDLLEVLNAICELLYQERKNEAYGILIKCLPILSAWIVEIEEEGMQVAVMESLQQAVQAMEADDITLLADILQYELIEHLEKVDG